MALLTEEQVKDVMAMFDCYASGRYKKSFEYDFGEWNEKQQPSTQYAPDWDTAPKWADKATIMVRWDAIGQTDTVTLSKSKRPATPHPHAEIMAKYAEVAQRRRDPWVEFQVYSYPFSYWVTLEVPIFFDSVQRYRHIGDVK